MLFNHPRIALTALLISLVVSCGEDKNDEKKSKANDPHGGSDPVLPDGFAKGSALLEHFCENVDSSAPGSLAQDVRKDVAIFAQDLSRKIFDGNTNTVLSPLSVQFVFSMLHGGAGGETQSQIVEALHLGASGYDVDKAYKILSADLRCAKSESSDEKLADVGLHLANAVWGAKNNPLVDSYTSFVRDSYAAEAQTLDFAQDPKGSVDAINAWSKEATYGKIPTVLNSIDVGEATNFIVTNAIHYKANWKTPFDKAQTKNAAFAVKGGDIAQVPTMHGSSLKTRYLEASDFEAIRLAFDNGDSMIFALPRTPTGLSAMIAQLKLDMLTAQTGWKDAFATLQMPKFKIELNQSLVEPLRSLGVTTAFTDQADFKGMLAASSGVGLSEVFQKAYIDVHEEGTEAAAVTVAIGEITSAPVDPQNIDIKFDRPFFYMIERRGAVLFTGTVVDPRNSEI